jgi:hypothetical protein
MKVKTATSCEVAAVCLILQKFFRFLHQILRSAQDSALRDSTR